MTSITTSTPTSVSVKNIPEENKNTEESIEESSEMDKTEDEDELETQSFDDYQENEYAKEIAEEDQYDNLDDMFEYQYDFECVEENSLMDEFDYPVVKYPEYIANSYIYC